MAAFTSWNCRVASRTILTSLGDTAARVWSGGPACISGTGRIRPTASARREMHFVERWNTDAICGFITFLLWDFLRNSVHAARAVALWRAFAKEGTRRAKKRQCTRNDFLIASQALDIA